VDTYSDVSKINPYVVVQEFIEGGEDQIFSVNMLIGSHGNLKGYFIAQKLRTYPIKAGEGCYIITVKDDYMAEMALNIARKLGLQGLLNIQFKRDQRTGEPVLLEIHTRNSVWSYLGTAAGVNLAAEYYRDLVEPSDNPIPVYKSNVTMVLLEKDVKAFLQNLRERQISIPRWISSYFKKIVWGGFRWSDPKPVMMRIWFFIMRRIFGNEYFRTT
jgi:predicted ATP-grasp superfamily ATP-dependent carboligase